MLKFPVLILINSALWAVIGSEKREIGVPRLCNQFFTVLGVLTGLFVEICYIETFLVVKLLRDGAKFMGYPGRVLRK